MTERPEVRPGWEAVIGMEVHVQIRTRSKMFCSCPADYQGAAPNSNVCAVCAGMPGVLPVINRAAVEKTVLAAAALGCRIAEHTKFDRKNYFYPDLPKGYQISQYDLPIATGGQLEIDLTGRRVRIIRVHLEEDTGKNVHSEAQLRGSARTFVDLNRSGVPLMEIVSEPDLRSAAEARDYAVALRRLLRHLDISDADMEKGQMRVEANISVRRAGDPDLGTKTEVKNINSFRSMYRAVEYEIERQIGLLEAGDRVVQETRGWSEAEQRTYSQRGKETAMDYRYFPEPDLPPLHLSPEWVERIVAGLVEAPLDRHRRYVAGFGLTDHDAGLITDDPGVAAYFEAVVAAGTAPRAAANWIIGDVLPRLRESGARAAEAPIGAAGLAALIGLVTAGQVNRDQAREVLAEAWASGQDPVQLARARGLSQVSDAGAIEAMVDAVITANPKAVADYRGGKVQAMGALMAALKQTSGGQANLKVAAEILRRKLSG